MAMRTLVKMVHGSHLFGTSTPESDQDFKAVHVPDAELLLLQRPNKIDHSGTTNPTNQKNTKDDVDVESFALHRYLSFVSENQTNAVEMLFAPESAYRMDPEPEWLELLANRDRIVSRKARTFAGYARGQAARYAIRGERVAAVRAVVDVLRQAFEASPHAKVETVTDALARIAATAGHTPDGKPLVELVDKEVRSDGATVVHLVVCAKMAPVTITVKEALGIFQKQLDNYGARSIRAEQTGAADWKAMSHALRIADEAVELLTTGALILPRPNADYLTAVKQGKVPLDEVSQAIEAALERIETASAASTLRAEPDIKWIDRFVLRVYGDAVGDWLKRAG